MTTELAPYAPTGASESGEQPVLYVVFSASGSDYALPAETVLQMESFEGATAVPGAPPFVAGVVQIRGRVLPVVDLRLRFGGTPGERVLDNRIVVGQLGERVVGLLVDSAREVVRLRRSEWKAPPALVASAGFVRGVAQIGTRLVMLLDFAKVIGEEQLDGVV
ncbi:MAG TPA: chemotaxis protein CheW [Polyangiaceae bacterium]